MGKYKPQWNKQCFNVHFLDTNILNSIHATNTMYVEVFINSLISQKQYQAFTTLIKQQFSKCVYNIT
jgi:hypothetical protein